MNVWLKFIFKTLSWGFAVLLFLLISLFVSGYPDGYCYFCPSIGTRFAPGFSEERFSGVHTGMSSIEVSNLLGRPLIVTEARGVEEWSYSLDRTNWFDVAWLVRRIDFTNGIVCRTLKQIAYD